MAESEEPERISIGLDDIDDAIDYQIIIDGIIRSKGRKWYEIVIEDSGVDPNDLESIVDALTEALATERKPGRPPIVDDEYDYHEYEVDYRLAASYHNKKSTREPRIIIDATFRYSSLNQNEDAPPLSIASAIFDKAKRVIEDYYRTDLDKDGEGTWKFDEGMGKPKRTGVKTGSFTDIEFVRSEMSWEGYSETITVRGDGPNKAAFKARGRGRSREILPVKDRAEVSIRTGEPI